jgi:hypothetical protein
VFRTEKVVPTFSETLPMRLAGLLARGSLRSPAFPPTLWAVSGIVGLRSPLTVAGAATVSVPDGYASPCSLLIPWRYGRGNQPHSLTMDRPARPAPLAPLIRPSGTFSHKGRREPPSIAVSSTLLPLWEKVDRPKAETDEGRPLAPATLLVPAFLQLVGIGEAEVHLGDGDLGGQHLGLVRAEFDIP